MSKDISFRLVKNKCATVVGMFSVDENRPLDAYFNASAYGIGFPLLQEDPREKGVMRPLL
ncbi:MAG: hypothetical protein JWR35_3883 [Marmoricola sp.]|nr:hypothetical protein [Marmoricola sp.]